MGLTMEPGDLQTEGFRAYLYGVRYTTSAINIYCNIFFIVMFGFS